MILVSQKNFLNLNNEFYKKNWWNYFLSNSSSIKIDLKSNSINIHPWEEILSF